ncbi:uncharacterized protein [Argopecten irradians]|uniref:uncharacterized protein n=1 Tax=Argopecten irradians TaxID=31199 RepID=UPI00371F52D5
MEKMEQLSDDQCEEKPSKCDPPSEPARDFVTLTKGPDKIMDSPPRNQPVVLTAETVLPPLASTVQETDLMPNDSAAGSIQSSAESGVESQNTEPGLSTPDSGPSRAESAGSDRQSILKLVKRNLKDTKREFCDLHKTLLPRERQLLIQKEQTALEVTKYFADIKIQVSKYLLEQEEKIHQELQMLTERESQHIQQDIVKCTTLMEKVDETEMELLSADSRSRRANPLPDGNSDLHELKRTIIGYSDMCSQMKTYADEPFNMRFMINTDLEDMLTNCNLVNIELITSRHTLQSRPSVSSETSSSRPSTSEEPDVVFADRDSDASDSETSKSSESEESSSESDEDDDSEDNDDDENADVSNQQSGLDAASQDVFNTSPVQNTRTAPTDNPEPAPAYEEEPPPPYPGLPQAPIPTASAYTTPHTAPRNPSGHSSSNVVLPSVTVYPPGESSQHRPSSGSSIEGRGETNSPKVQHRQSPRQTQHYRRRSAESIGSSGSGTSLQDAGSDSTHRNQTNNTRRRYNEGSNESHDEPVHPALRLPSATNSSPSAPPLPMTSFTTDRNEGHSTTSTLYPQLNHPLGVGRRSPNMSRRSQRPVPGSGHGDPSRPIHRFREKKYTPPFSLKFNGRCNAAIAADERPPGLVGIANMADYIVVVDRWNFKLKLIKNRSVKSVLFFGTFEPWDVTGVSDTRCAVTVPKASEICIASRHGSKLKLEKRISTSRGYSCIQYHKRKDLFLCGCCPQFGRPHVAVVTMEGRVLKSFHDDANNKTIFDYPRSIDILGEETFVVVDNNKNNVIFMKMDGTVFEAYRGYRTSFLEDAQGVTVHPYLGFVLVSDAKKNSLHVLSSKGHYRGCISGGTEMSNPRRLMVVGLNNPHLVVAHGNGYVSQFDLVHETRPQH